MGEQYVAPLDPFERECITKVAVFRTVELLDRSGPAFQKAVTREQLTALDARLSASHHFDGTFQRVAAFPEMRMIDEGVGKDAFTFYDFVGSRFILSGAPHAAVDLYIAKVGGEPRLVGFQIVEEQNDEKTRLLYPETVDAAGIGRRQTTYFRARGTE